MNTYSIDTDVDYIKEVQEKILDGISSVFDGHIVNSNYGAFQTDNVAKDGYYIVQWTSMPYILSETYVCFEYNTPQIFPGGTYV